MRLFLSFFFFAASVNLSAQRDYDSRLLAKFSKEQIAMLQNEHPQEIAYMEFYIENGISIIANSQEKNIQPSAEVRLKSLDVSKLNIFELGLPLPLDRSTFYAIKGSDKILVVHARESVTLAFNKLQKN